MKNEYEKEKTTRYNRQGGHSFQSSRYTTCFKTDYEDNSKTKKSPRGGMKITQGRILKVKFRRGSYPQLVV